MRTHERRVALVTGAASGIGRETAIRLAERGAELILVDLEDPVETAAMIGGDPMRLTGDVGYAESWAGFARAISDRQGGVDIVVNNAGIYPAAPIDELSHELWSRTFRINVEAHFLSAKAMLPLMRPRGWGRFVNIASNIIGTASPGLSHYISSKMAVIGFVRGLANDVAQDGITVNAILPSITRTPGTNGLPDEVTASIWGQQPIKRYADPCDIVGSILFLTSDDAAFITGQALAVDGGLYKAS